MQIYNRKFSKHNNIGTWEREKRADNREDTTTRVLERSKITIPTHKIDIIIDNVSYKIFKINKNRTKYHLSISMSQITMFYHIEITYILLIMHLYLISIVV